MAEITGNLKNTAPEQIESDKSESEQSEAENLSTKISNIAVVNSSLQTVTKTCHSIKESNSYVGYGMTVAETSLDKAFKAGKAVLDSRTLAPITNTAMENIRYLDKEAGVMVEKLLKSNEKPDEERQANGGAVQEISENSAVKSSDLAVENESMVYFLGRKFFEVTSFLIFLPYFAPKYALSTIWGLFQGGARVGRKRKERGSLSEELKYMEPSPVKRKYGDRLSTSSEEGTLVEILRDYVSEDDPDYVPDEHESEETSDESGNEKDRGEEVKECLDLTQELEKMGVSLSPDMKRNVERLKSEASEGEANDCQSTPKKTTELATSKDKTAETTSGEKSQEKITDSNAAEQQKLEEISLKASSDGGKDKTEVSKGSKLGKIDPSSKTRKSSKSPLLEKLLSPGRRSRRGQKDKKGSSETTEITEDVAGGKASKSEDNTNMVTVHGEKVTDNAKIAEVEAKANEAAKSKGKTEDGQKKSEKAETSKGEVKDDGRHHGNETLSTVTGPFDAFKFGGKKSK